MAATTTAGAKGKAAEKPAKARGRFGPEHTVNREPAPLAFYALAVIIAILVALGLVMVLSASSVTSLRSDGSGWAFFERQALWCVLGIVALFITLKVPYHAWRPMIPLALFGSFALMVLVLVPGIGRMVNGARAWIPFGPFAVQPAELLKLVMLLYCADLLARRADRMHELRATLYPLLLVLGGAGVLIMLQPDLGGGIVLCAIVLGVAFIGGAPLGALGATSGLVGIFGLFFITRASYRRDRWLAFLDLAQHKQDSGWQVWQSLIGIASGGITGVGLGASKAKWGYLPEAHTDFIFAIIAEELGLLGAVAVCGLFCAFGLFGIQVALRAKDRFGMLLAGGITAWVLVQALINIGGVVGMMPLTGLTLPFVSFGGSSLLVTMAAGGLLLNVRENGTMNVTMNDEISPRSARRSGAPRSTFAVITGGGTAGHVLPGLAIAEALVELGHQRDTIHFLGASRGMEATLVPEAGFPLTMLDVRGMRRSFSPANIGTAAHLTGSVRRAVGLLRRLGTQVVVSVGGYASVPGVMAATMLRVPVLVVSYDVRPGAASRLAARLATASAVAFENSPLPRQVVTGAPIRKEILAVEPARDRAAARHTLGLPQDRFIALIVGGSLGSGKLNDVTTAFVEHNRGRADLGVRHVVGARNDDGSWLTLDGTDGLLYQPVGYEPQMELAYAAADVVVAHAGATTIAELAALGLPSILVPWKDATEDHQTANARVLADVGAAVLVPEHEFDASRLVSELDRLRLDPHTRAAMSTAARSVSRRTAAVAIARLAEECAKK